MQPLGRWQDARPAAVRPASRHPAADQFEALVMEQTVMAALERELKAIAKRDPALAQSTVAATACALARELDSPNNSATSKSMCAKAMYDAIDRLYELAPAEKDKDGVDDIAAQREARRARLAAS
jgi:hypothetical protein